MSAQPTEKQLISIADRMLEQLQEQYMQIQKHNPKANIEQAAAPQQQQNDHQGYVLLDNNQYDAMQPFSDEENENDKAKPQQGHKSDQLMEVAPTQQWVCEQREININAEKVKECALKIDLPMPAWMQDQTLLKDRVWQLFGGKNKRQV